MKMPRDQQLARQLMESRDRGTTWGSLIHANIKVWVILVGLALVAFVVCRRIGRYELAWGAAGMVSGAILRDLGWFRTLRARWSFTTKVVDWEKVRRLADGDGSAR